MGAGSLTSNTMVDVCSVRFGVDRVMKKVHSTADSSPIFFLFFFRGSESANEADRLDDI